MEAAAGDAFCSAVAAGSTVISCFSVTAVPFALLSGLIGKDFSLKDSFYPVPQDPPAKKRQPRSSSSDMAFTTFETSLRAPVKECTAALSWAVSGMRCPPVCLDRSTPDPGGGGGVLIFLLLAYLVLLSRGNLPPAARRAIALCMQETRSTISGRVSSFAGIPYVR